MLTLTTTQFRQNLAEVFSKVSAGQEIILIMGRGRKAKKIKLTNQVAGQEVSSLTESVHHANIQKFLNSATYKNFQPEPSLVKASKPSKLLLEDLVKKSNSQE